MTLYDKLKPHIKDKLDSQAKKYISIGYIYDKLKNKREYLDINICIDVCKPNIYNIQHQH